MSHYSDGRRDEYKARDDLQANGYSVIRSAGSKGAVDLIAVKPGEVLFVQVKRTTAPGPSAWNALWELASWAGAIPVLATTPLRKPVGYQRLTAPKVKRGAAAPLAPFLLDRVSGESHENA